MVDFNRHEHPIFGPPKGLPDSCTGISQHNLNKTLQNDAFRKLHKTARACTRFLELYSAERPRSNSRRGFACAFFEVLDCAVRCRLRDSSKARRDLEAFQSATPSWWWSNSIGLWPLERNSPAIKQFRTLFRGKDDEECDNIASFSCGKDSRVLVYRKKRKASELFLGHVTSLPTAKQRPARVKQIWPQVLPHLMAHLD